MYLVGLTGGIASGKSMVAERLVANGAKLIDADVIARQVVEPGTVGLAGIVKRFGGDILLPDGTLDRDQLAAIVFADSASRKDLEAITHPLIGGEIARQLQANAAADNIVILDVALLVEGGRSGHDSLVVVAAHPETQIKRMQVDRGMTREDAAARIAAQAPLEEKLALADYVIWNEGTLHDLEVETDRVWTELLAAAAAKCANSD